MMMELDPKYVDVIVKRWQEYTGESAIHADTGDIFAKLENVA
jgi:DNA modification methylase